MLASQRRATILGLIEDSGAVRVSELVDQLGVSDMTVRRDIEHLATEGLVERVHGGALSVGSRSSEEPGFTAKSALMQSQKNAIAQAAAQLVEPGAAIGISAGTTTYEFARAVRSVPDLTVVTNSVPVAQLLHESGTPGQTVVLTGGVRTPSDALVGPVAVAALRMLHVDRLFLGVHGMDARAGLTTPNLVEAETNQALVQTARQVCVLADHTKWGTVGLSTIIPLSSVDLLVTDAGLGPRARTAVSEAGVEVVLATPAPLRTARTSRSHA
ncbi:DeoR/GlpR family DNA-binding transcription regulator [Pedococcus sp. KACC 23699]|uniref:DeoR/GlpR family DNA-binding transcription regulator n=1 Tax=Pedococcus sp. KACC 23699 TaxID=3149228 RepID=A0AAU7JW24_9MICO